MDSSSNIPTFLAQQFPSIHILLAIETGSRAHGLATKNSDHDVKGFFSSKDKKIQRIK